MRRRVILYRFIRKYALGERAEAWLRVSTETAREVAIGSEIRSHSKLIEESTK